mmetsp:Transcript_16479/g.34420  ORF Transcript_16479/g.34420 Transcript_16479/m.34420 type:complete len:247 (+) Transcript_16479:140-880(+)
MIATRSCPSPISTLDASLIVSTSASPHLSTSCVWTALGTAGARVSVSSSPSPVLTSAEGTGSLPVPFTPIPTDPSTWRPTAVASLRMQSCAVLGASGSSTKSSLPTRLTSISAALVSSTIERRRSCSALTSIMPSMGENWWTSSIPTCTSTSRKSRSGAGGAGRQSRPSRYCCSSTLRSCRNAGSCRFQKRFGGSCASLHGGPRGLSDHCRASKSEKRRTHAQPTLSLCTMPIRSVYCTNLFSMSS